MKHIFALLLVSLVASATYVIPAPARGGEIFVAADGGVSEFDSSTGVPLNTSFGISGMGLGPAGAATGIAISGNDLFVGAYTGRIGEYTTSGAAVNASLITGLSEPVGIAVSGGNVFVGNQSSGTVGEYTTSGAVVNASLITGLTDPDGIMVSGGDIFVGNGDAISEYTTSGALVNGSFITELDGPVSFAVSGEDLFIALLGNGTNGTIGEYDATTGAAINASLVTGIANLASLAVYGGDLYTTSLIGTGTIGEYTTSGATVNAALVALPFPWGIVVVPEPATWTLLAIGAVALLACQVRMRRP